MTAQPHLKRGGRQFSRAMFEVAAWLRAAEAEEDADAYRTLVSHLLGKKIAAA